MINFIIISKNNDLKSKIKDDISNSALSKYYDYEFITKFNTDNNLIMFYEINDLNDIKNASVLKVKYNINTLIFLSKNNDLVFESLKANPLNFIRLDNFDNDLKKSISLIDSYLKNLNTIFTFKTNTSILRLNISNIMYAESFGHYVTFHSTSGEYKIREKISNIEEQFKHSNFIRVHKSYIVNIKFIKEVFRNKLILNDNTDIPIGNIYKDLIFNALK